MTEQTFKVGDKVYCPTIGNGIFTLKSGYTKAFPLKIITDNNGNTFTTSGQVYVEHKAPSIFKANKENQELLSKLYGIEFENPVSFLDHRLSIGSKVLCLLAVKEPKKLPENVGEIDDRNEFIIIIVSNKLDGKYRSNRNIPIQSDYLYPIAINENGNITYLE